MAEYPVRLRKVSGKKLTLLVDEDDKSVKLLVDDKVADAGKEPGHFVLLDDEFNGIEVECGLGGDGKPWMKANGEDVSIHHLAWYEWGWIGLPGVLVFAGGCIGGMIGGAAIACNMGIMRTNKSALFRYGTTAAVSAAAVVVYVVVGLGFGVAFDKKTRAKFIDGFRSGYRSGAQPATVRPAAQPPPPAAAPAAGAPSSGAVTPEKQERKNEPLAAEDMSSLLAAAEKESGERLKAVLRKLDACGADVPEERLLAFAAGKGGEADDVRAEWAVKLLGSRGRLDSLAGTLPRLSEKSRASAARAAVSRLDDPANERLLLAMLELPPAKDNPGLQPLYAYMTTSQCEVDEKTLDTIDVFMAKIEDENERGRWSRAWNRKVVDHAMQSQELSAKLSKKLADVLTTDKERREAILSTIVAKADPLFTLGLLTQLPANSKLQVIRYLPARDKERFVEESVPVLWELAKGDTDKGVRRASLQWLADSSASLPDFIKQALELAKSDGDAGDFEDQLWAFCAGKIGRLDPAGALRVAAVAPAKRWVKSAVDVIARKRDDLPLRLRELLAVYSSCDFDDRRQWLMEAAGEEISHMEYLLRDKKMEQFNALKSFFSAGMDDKSAAAARAAALKGAIRLNSPDWPTRDEAWKVVKDETDPKRREELELFCDRWVFAAWESKVRDLKHRQTAIPLLLEIANRTSNERLAGDVMRSLPSPDSAETAYIDELLKIAASPRYSSRIDVLRKLCGEPLDKNKKVLDAYLKALADPEPDVRREIFNNLVHRVTSPGMEGLLEKLKAAAAHESVVVLKSEMTRQLENYEKVLDAQRNSSSTPRIPQAPQQKPPQRKNAK